MKTIPLLTVGTYYKYGSPSAGPNAYMMQGLVWWVKDNRQDLTTTFPLQHRALPPEPIGSQAAAYSYSARALAAIWGPRHQDEDLVLVPIPSSGVTAATMNGRWPARRLADQLAANGIGRVELCLVQASPTEAFQHPTVEALVENYVQVRTPTGRVVFVDDVVTRGRHVVAADICLGAPASSVVAVGATHSVTQDAYDPVRGSIDYYRLGGNVIVNTSFP